MKRVRVAFDSESAARSEGLKRERAQGEGFDCPCGKHQNFSPYTIAHWADVLQHRCVQCGRVHKMHKGVVTEISGPVKRQSKVPGKMGALDPRKPLWRTYQPLHSIGRSVTYQATGDYADTLDLANDAGWDYANKAEPHNRQRREDLFRTLIRREEYPLLSTIEVSGLVVGGGDIQMVGSGIDPARGLVYYVELRTPKGEVARITFTEEVFAEIMRSFELRPMSEKELNANRGKAQS